jgi:hypothetical protein
LRPSYADRGFSADDATKYASVVATTTSTR